MSVVSAPLLNPELELLATVDVLAALTIGEDPLRIEKIVAKLQDGTGDSCGPGGIFMLALGLGLGALPWLNAIGLVGSTPFSAGRVYPNPWRSDRHSSFLVTFDGLPSGSTLRLFTLSGQESSSSQSNQPGSRLW